MKDRPHLHHRHPRMLRVLRLLVWVMLIAAVRPAGGQGTSNGETSDADVPTSNAASDAAASDGPPIDRIRSYVYIEPFEIRLETTLPLASLGLDDTPTLLDPVTKETLLQQAQEQLAAAYMLKADGRVLVAQMRQTQWIALDPELGPIADERESIPASDALLGAVFVTAQDDFPKRLDIDWTLYAPTPDGTMTVPLEIEVTGAGISEQLLFSPDNPTQSYQLPDMAPAPRMQPVADVPTGVRRGPYIVAAILGVAGIGLLGLGSWSRIKDRTSVLLSGGLSLLLAIGVSYDAVARPSTVRVNQTQASGIVQGLLTNIYYAFAFRDESTIFDTLEQSVDGPLLEELYLDIRRGLELEESGGPRVKVLRVSLIDCVVLQANDGGLRVRAVWASTGDVSHWGHTHRRRNQYRGELQIQAVDGQWKVSEVDILSEERT